MFDASDLWRLICGVMSGPIVFNFALYLTSWGVKIYKHNL